MLFIRTPIITKDTILTVREICSNIVLETSFSHQNHIEHEEKETFASM